MISIEEYVDRVNNPRDQALCAGLLQAWTSGEPTWISRVPEVYGRVIEVNLQHEMGGMEKLKYSWVPMSPPEGSVKVRRLNSYDIIRIVEYPRLSRLPIDVTSAAAHSQQFHLGPLKIKGCIIIHTTEIAFVLGETVEVSFDVATWRGIVDRWCVKYNTDGHSPDYGKIYAEVAIQPTGRPTFASERRPVHEMVFPINYLEDTSMKIYDGVVVDLDEKKEPKSVVKVIEPFVAEDAKAAREQSLVDFAAEKQITGKDLAGYSVRIREFQSTAS